MFQQIDNTASMILTIGGGVVTPEPPDPQLGNEVGKTGSAIRMESNTKCSTSRLLRQESERESGIVTISSDNSKCQQDQELHLETGVQM
jgi:hypothetical protein